MRLGDMDPGLVFFMRLSGKPPVCVYACYCHPSWALSDEPCPSYDFGNCCTVPYAGCDQIIGAVTIQKPAEFSGQAVQVVVDGNFDDDIAVNGVPTGYCRGAGIVNKSFQMGASEDSFELGAVDSYGACGHGTLSICFSV